MWSAYVEALGSIGILFAIVIVLGMHGVGIVWACRLLARSGRELMRWRLGR